MKRFDFQLDIQRCIRLAAFTTLLGWGLIHIIWEGPYRTLLWSEDYFSHIVEGLLQINWQEYANSPTVNQNIKLLSKFIGVFLVLTSFITFFSKDLMKRYGQPLIISSFIFIIMFLIQTLEMGFKWAMFIEHGSQIMIPTICYLYFSDRLTENKLLFYLKIAVGLTFLGHGLFAIGFYPVPGKFTDMVIEILGTSESTAKHLLAFAGIVDFALCILIWIPDTAKFAAAYCVFWGFVTALARPVSYLFLEVIHFDSSIYWLLQFLYRGPHYLVPLAILIFILNSNKKVST